MNWIENLKKIMDDKKVNIEKLKDLIEKEGHSLSRNSISNILNENNSPKIETIQVIAKALNVDISEIFKASPADTAGLNGFIDYKGTIYRIQSIDELEKFLDEVKGNL